MVDLGWTLGGCMVCLGLAWYGGGMCDLYLAHLVWIICGSCVDVVVGKCIVDLAGSLVDLGYIICRCCVCLGLMHGGY